MGNEGQIKTTDDVKWRPGKLRVFFRWLLGLIAIALVLIGVIIGGAFLYFQGNSFEHEAINKQLEMFANDAVDQAYYVNLGPTRLSLKGLSRLSVSSTDVEIRTRDKHLLVAQIKRVFFGVNPMSLLDGAPQVTTVTIEQPQLDLNLLGWKAPQILGGDMATRLKDFGDFAKNIPIKMSANNLNKIEIRNGKLWGFKLGSGSKGELDIRHLNIHASDRANIDLELQAATGKSDIKLNANLITHLSGESEFRLKFGGIDISEWQEYGDENQTDIDAQAKVSGTANFIFKADGSVQPPTARMIINKGKLRLGRSGDMKIERVEINLRAIPQQNQIVIDRSQLKVEGFTAEFLALISPAEAGKGLEGDLNYALNVINALGTPSEAAEKVHAGNITSRGSFIRDTKLLNVDDFKLQFRDGSLVGSARIGFDGSSPSLVLNAGSDGMAVNAARQFWPIFMGTRARTWALERVHGGRIKSARFTARVPPGILGRLHLGKRIEPEHLQIEMDLEGARVDLLGEVPPIRNANAKLRLKGMAIDVDIEKAQMFDETGVAVDLKSGNFKVRDFGKEPVFGELDIQFAGPMNAIASITNSKPLGLMERVKMSSAKWQGNAEIDLFAKFPVRPGEDRIGQTDWKAKVKLKNVKSDRPINGRKIDKVFVTINASPGQATIKGKARVDGISGNIEMREPVGKTPKVTRKRVMEANLGQKDLKGMGLDLGPILSGKIDIRIEQNGDDSFSTIKINLKKAKLSLPWVSWSKGKGISASALFRMKKTAKGTQIKDLTLSGKGFKLSGSLALNKSGLISADFPVVALNRGDNLSINVKRKKSVYLISAVGKSYDARGLLKKLFHDEGVGDEQGKSTFQMTANIKNVRGFGSKVKNLDLRYNVNAGWLNSLKLNAVFDKNNITKIDASSKSGTTVFLINSQNAGSALSFVDLYKRMEGGRLSAKLKRKKGGSFTGNVEVRDFVVVDEPKLKALAAGKREEEYERDDGLIKRLQENRTQRIPFKEARSYIEKGNKYLKVDGSLSGQRLGLTYVGTMYDKNNRMNLRGTFLRSAALDRANARKPILQTKITTATNIVGLVGITYSLIGSAVNPKINVNPLSIITPGVLRKVFQPRRRKLNP